MSHNQPYNPLAKGNLGESVAEALLRVVTRPLTDTDDLLGAGVYAIYYVGSFPAYRPIVIANVEGQFSQPIYVGKAVPKGSRKGGLGFDSATGVALRDRLRQHAASIDQSSNLELRDFYYRSLVVDDIWIPLGENVLIERFQPLWNRVIDGFGNKDPGKGRLSGQRSPWDVVHPGRSFAEKLAKNSVPEKEILQKVAQFLAGALPEAELTNTVDDGDEPQ